MLDAMTQPRLEAIIMAFNATWSLKGGLSYLADTIRGEEPCELCKITYGGLTKKAAWSRCEKELRTPVEEVYRNQLDEALAAAIAERFPMVLARTDQGYVPLLLPAQLDTFGGDPLKLHQALLDAIEEAGLQVGSG
jgi:hypothetical protein